MPTTEEIIKYVQNTPLNTNPNVLRGMLKQYQIADSDEIIEANCAELLNRTYGSNA